jgi:hypothetical protein
MPLLITGRIRCLFSNIRPLGAPYTTLSLVHHFSSRHPTASCRPLDKASCAPTVSTAASLLGTSWCSTMASTSYGFGSLIQTGLCLFLANFCPFQPGIHLGYHPFFAAFHFFSMGFHFVYHLFLASSHLSLVSSHPFETGWYSLWRLAALSSRPWLPIM